MGTQVLGSHVDGIRHELEYYDDGIRQGRVGARYLL